jgi:L-phenylalanine/L-methionine N-acetyltransferase
MTLRVRAQEPDDIAAITEILNCPRVVHGTLQLPLRSVAERQAWAEVPRGMHRLVAEFEGHVVGMLTLHQEMHPRRGHAAGIGMGVHDDFQGKGIGTALMDAMIDLADNWLNLRRIELTVYADNEPAVRLYRKFGFEVEGTLRNYAFRDGQLIDALSMARVRA